MQACAFWAKFKAASTIRAFSLRGGLTVGLEPRRGHPGWDICPPERVHIHFILESPS